MDNKVRIGGGEFRSRIISFPENSAIRPTPDRVKQTLFNWLGQSLYGKKCLDLFAGSGALGFEALSRGAEKVVMVEMDRKVCRSLADNAEKLHCQNRLDLICMDALEFAQGDGRRYDVIFLDPPFDQDFLPRLFPYLPDKLSPNGLVYVETGEEKEIPPHWRSHKRAKAGKVVYQLLMLNE